MKKTVNILLVFSIIITHINFSSLTVSAQSNVSGISESIENKYVPYAYEIDEEYYEEYNVTAEDFQQLLNAYLGEDKNRNSINDVGDIPPRTSVTYGSVSVSSVAALAAFFAVYLGAPAAWSLSSAVLSLLGAGTAYYSYTHTSWRTNGILFVRSTITIYSNSNYTGYVTATTINKQYSDNMLD